MALKNTYDLIIIGAGPAGMTAGVYAARKQLDSIIIAPEVGGQTTWSSDIENYLGFMYITGTELVAKFEEHLNHFEIELEYAKAIDVSKTVGGFTIETDTGNFSCRAIIVASGKSPKMLNVPGETEFRGKGVAYCATCDAPLFSGMDVAVVGGGNSGLDAAVQLMKICPRVYLIEYEEELRADEIVLSQVREAKNVEILKGTSVEAVHGDNFVSGLTVKDRKTEKERRLDVSGVFIEVGLSPNAGFIGDIVKLNANGEIPVDCAGRTGVPGVYAAGDVTDVPEKQIIIAAGDGAKAALGAYSYLVRLPLTPDWSSKTVQ